jgi:murein L,D-transpeptidase YafK
MRHKIIFLREVKVNSCRHLLIMAFCFFGLCNYLFSEDENHTELPTDWQCSYSDSMLIASMYGQSIEDRALEMLGTKTLGSIKLVIYKTWYMLEFLSDSTVLKRYPIALGFNPVDDKLKEGDGCTPEGEFYICRRINPSQFYKAFLFSYPNKEDAERGLRKGIINTQQYDQIVSAINESSTPPQYTGLGGLVEIHGEGVGSNWTLGCIAMENRDIDEIWKYVKGTTTVEIMK